MKAAAARTDVGPQAHGSEARKAGRGSGVGFAGRATTGLTPHGAGEPLAAPVRASMAGRFGQDFADVRVHADPASAAVAEGIGARAYTAGSSIVFGRGQYAPGAPEGQRLIAHELAHVVQQRGQQGGRAAVAQGSDWSLADPGDPAEHEADRVATTVMAGGAAGRIAAMPRAATVYRFPYETRSFVNSSNVSSWASASYWLQRTSERYFLTPSNEMNSDAEERDAVLAALWGINPPATVAAATVRIVPIAARPAPPAAAPAAPGTAAPAAPAAPAALLYRFTFSPPATGQTLPGLLCERIAAGGGAVPLTPPAPVAGTTLAAINANSDGFPGGRDAYLAAHPDELAKLQGWLATAPATFDQILTLTTTNRTGTVTHQTHVHAVRTSAQTDIDYLSEAAMAPTQAPPADYRTRDAMDFEFEKLRRTTRAAGDRLGTVTLPAGIPAGEVIPVKLAIQGYFAMAANPARNTEVDAIIPLGNAAGQSVMYQLNFGAHNNVTATRIGIAGTAAGEVNTSRLDIMRVKGFPGLQASDAALRSWWASRYPAGGALTSPVPGPPPPPPPSGVQFPTFPNAPLVLEMSVKVATDHGTAAWFSGNYGITVLTGSALTTRLTSVHSVDATLLTDTVDFTAADFTALEVALETLSPADIVNLRGTNVGRKTSSFFQGTGGVWQAGAATQYGYSLSTGGGANRTTVYFDSYTAGNGALFRGSNADNAIPDAAMNMLHELGHDTGYGGGIEAAFTAWRAAHMAQAPAPTWYGASAGTEVFPEYFGLFHTDPHFLCGAAPQAYAWFAELARTGTPPAANATLTPPATCPP